MDVYLKNLFEDYVFYWDFNDLFIFDVFWDVFVVCVVVFVLLELFGYLLVEKVLEYKQVVVKMLVSLSFDKYQCGKSKFVFLFYFIGYLFVGLEIDVFIIYVDYYYMEVFFCLKRLMENKLVIDE